MSALDFAARGIGVQTRDRLRRDLLKAPAFSDRIRIMAGIDSLTDGAGGSTWRTAFAAGAKAALGDGGVGIRSAGLNAVDGYSSFALSSMSQTGSLAWTDPLRQKSFFGNSGMLDPWILARRPLVKKVHAALFERPLLRRACVHALNDAEREAVASFMPALAERTFVVPNGISDTPGRVESKGKRGMLFLGRLHPKKQVLELIRAWRALDLPRSERLTIAGWGDAEYEASVRQAAAADPTIKFVGSLHGDAKTEALLRARFFVLPSLSEGLPMAVLEAIQHGCIPIITPQCNLPELVNDGVALAIANNFSDFSSIVVRAVGFSEAEADKRSAAAVACAQNYLWSRIAQQMANQYANCRAEPARS